MNRLQLFRLLRRNTNLSYRRNPAFDQNRWAKALLYLGAAFFAIYLVLYGALIGMASEGDAGTMIAFMIIILPIDFGLRFIVQTTPAIMAKPYLLMPFSRYTVIECFLLSGHISGYNLLWLVMFVTYSVVILFAGCLLFVTLYVLLLSLLFIILNSQVYLFFRTLIRRSVLWMLPAIALYALPFVPLILNPSAKTFHRLLDMFAAWGESWWLMLVVGILLVGLFFINRYFQFRFVYEEVSRQKEHSLRHVYSFAFLDRFGIEGEYLKLELKSNIRNKAMRSRCMMSLALVVVFSLLVAYTDIYDNVFMTNFWCMYCFAIYSITSLVKIMGQEGNYIDLLMTNKETIIQLLRAKFWFYGLALIIPFVLMLPAVFTGKFTLLMLLSFMLLTAGFTHFLIFQLAVYNKQTLPLNQKVSGKGNIENGIQIVIELVAMFAPGVIVAVGFLTIGSDATYFVMGLIGLAFVLLHPLWIRNVYHRMMVRRYENIEGFYSTREN